MEGDTIEVAELFAGVGGFRLGLEGDGYKFVFSNQWEPGEVKQWASKIYEERFGSDGHSNDNIHDFTFPIDGIANIPDHDLLVGGFPCQDYSVARTISGELGIKGEKGKLWVDIARIIRHKRPRPKVVLLENVPRLLNSPANARGLNFAIILNDLIRMGYNVEWRVINAADYGMPQQRSRVFILAYRTPGSGGDPRRINGPKHFGCRRPSRGIASKWLFEEGPFAEAFPVNGELGKKPEIVPPLDHPFSSKSSPFGNSGYAWKKQMKDGEKHLRVNVFWSTKVKADYDGERQTLGDVLVDKHDPSYELDNGNGLLDRYAYMKGEQKEWRIRKKDADKARGIEGDLWELYQKCTRGYRTDWWVESREDPRYLEGLGQGLIYDYTAGAMAYPDSKKKASRTVVTAEIGKSVSRMRHVIEYEEGKFRGLMPLELERLNMFPDNWTEYEGISDSRRGFLMGNALVVGVVERLAGPLAELIRDRSEQ
jgi:DNA (cytosine-5)-methyltransferase 1